MIAMRRARAIAVLPALACLLCSHALVVPDASLAGTLVATVLFVGGLLAASALTGSTFAFGLTPPLSAAAIAYWAAPDGRGDGLLLLAWVVSALSTLAALGRAGPMLDRAVDPLRPRLTNGAARPVVAMVAGAIVFHNAILLPHSLRRDDPPERGPGVTATADSYDFGRPRLSDRPVLSVNRPLWVTHLRGQAFTVHTDDGDWEPLSGDLEPLVETEPMSALFVPPERVADGVDGLDESATVVGVDVVGTPTDLVFTPAPLSSATELLGVISERPIVRSSADGSLRLGDADVNRFAGLEEGETWVYTDAVPGGDEEGGAAVTPPENLGAHLDRGGWSPAVQAAADEALADLDPELADDPEMVAWALDTWLAENVEYSLDAPLPSSGEDRTEHFLEVRQGWCDSIATAFVLMARAAGLPARFVTGYALSSLGEEDHIVRERNFHAWAEVWIPDLGWMSVDPTQGVSLAPGPRDRETAPDTGAALLWFGGGLAAVALVGGGVALARLVLRRRRPEPDPTTPDAPTAIGAEGPLTGALGGLPAVADPLVVAAEVERALEAVATAHALERHPTATASALAAELAERAPATMGSQVIEIGRRLDRRLYDPTLAADHAGEGGDDWAAELALLRSLAPASSPAEP